MSQANPISIDDDEDEDQDRNPKFCSFESPQFKKPRTELQASPPILVIDDDPTPQKPGLVPVLVSATPSPLFVPETPFSRLSKLEGPIVRCCNAGVGDLPVRSSSPPARNKFGGISGLISLESDNELETESPRETSDGNDTMDFGFDRMKNPWLSSTIYGESKHSSGNVNSSQMSRNSPSSPPSSQHDINEVNNQPACDTVRLEQLGNVLGHSINASIVEKRSNDLEKKITDKATEKKRITKEERARLMEEKKRQKEQEKLQKAALKAEAAEMKKLEKEKHKWEKGKFAIKSIVAEIDTKVVELGSIGGHLLSRFSEKGLKFRVTSNPIERSILWTMTAPEEISQLASEGILISYVLLVYEAEEFCSILLNESFVDHVSRVQSRYPSYTICYLINKLMAYINKREQAHYKNPANNNGWKRPPVEEVMAKLAINFNGVHSRLCIDEAELAEHVVGLTCSLAACQFRKKLTRLSVNANGSLIPKDCIDRNLIKKSTWLKALVAIPKVQPRFAIAIWKKYPTMKSLLSIYMDPSRSVHEKEFLLKDLTTEGLLGDDRRLGEICSKRVYRVLMAQNGSIKTDDVEDGADFFMQ